MAVIVQQMVGARHGTRFYPDIAGVAKSYNFYSVAPQKPSTALSPQLSGSGRRSPMAALQSAFAPSTPDICCSFFPRPRRCETIRRNSTPST